MKYDFEDLYEGPRFQHRARRRKIKLIVSGIIGLLTIVILIVTVSMFSRDSEQAIPAADTQIANQEENSEVTSDTDVTGLDRDIEQNTDTYQKEIDQQNDNQSNEYLPTEGTAIAEQELEKEANNEPTLQTNDENVLDVIEGDWDTVETAQEGPHVTDFTKGSEDWKEMMVAISMATGLSEDSMIVWWLGNGGGPNKAVSTISTLDQQDYYRIQLEWIDNQGWKPVTVEQLAENDHKPETEDDEDNE